MESLPFVLLDKDSKAEVPLEKAHWLMLEPEVALKDADPIYWGVGNAYQWQSRNCFNAIWDELVLKEYDHPWNTPYLHIRTNANLDKPRAMNVGVVHVAYEGTRLGIPESMIPEAAFSEGFLQVNASLGYIYPGPMNGKPSQEAFLNEKPYPLQRGTKHLTILYHRLGLTEFVWIAHLRSFIGKRIEEDWGKPIVEMLENKKRRLEDYQDRVTIVRPAMKEVAEAEENGTARKPRKDKRINVLLYGSKEPSDAREVLEEGKQYRIVNARGQVKKGIEPITWDGGSLRSVTLLETAFDNSWPIIPASD